MEDSSQIVQLSDELHPRSSQNTQLAAALTALGIPLDAQLPPQHFVEDVAGERKHRTTWTLAPCSPDEKYHAEPLMRVWNDDSFLRATPRHPLAEMRLAFRCYAVEMGKDNTLLSIRGREEPDPALAPVAAQAILDQWDVFGQSTRPPATPVEYVIQAFRNHRALVRFICETQGPIAVKRRGKRIALITKHTTPEDRVKIFAGLNAPQ
jgi:hypothetical protein